MVRNSRERSSSVSYERKFICASLTSLPRFGVRSASFPKKGITEGYFAKSDATVLSPPAFGEIALENSAVHCLPKATLLFSLLQPSVKLLLKIPRCTAASAHPSHPMVQRLILGQWLQQMPYRQRSPSRFCFHFFSFTFFLLFSLHFFPLFFSPSEFTIEMMA